MSEFDQLGEALRKRLHAHVEDVQPSAELMAAVDAIPSAHTPARRRVLERLKHRRIALALPLPVAALVATAVIVFGASDVSTSPAGAIRVLPNGEVRMMLNQLTDVAAANAELRRHHIHNIVVIPMTASCPDRNWTYTAGYLNPDPPVTMLSPREIAPGYTVVLAAKDVGGGVVVDAFNRFKGKLPTCASSHGTGPGMGDLLPANRKKPK
jgi:hypothetical protein